MQICILSVILGLEYNKDNLNCFFFIIFCFFSFDFRPGFHLQQVMKDSAFKNEPLSGDFQLSSVSSIVDRLLQSLENRFDDIQSNVLAATKIANIQTWPMAYDDSTILDYVFLFLFVDVLPVLTFLSFIGLLILIYHAGISRNNILHKLSELHFMFN